MSPELAGLIKTALEPQTNNEGGLAGGQDGGKGLQGPGEGPQAEKKGVIDLSKTSDSTLETIQERLQGMQICLEVIKYVSASEILGPTDEMTLLRKMMSKQWITFYGIFEEFCRPTKR